MSKSRFDFNDLVKCKFRGKVTYGLIATKEGEHMRMDTPHIMFEHKYKIVLLNSKRPQLKWAHELQKISSFLHWDDAFKALVKKGKQK